MSSTPPNTPTAGGNPPPLPPPRVPDHELIRRIGRGAYGEVWLARCATGAYRAVKIVHRQSFDHDRPFEREFEGILKFEPVSRTHDSQVDILHVGRGDDCFYYVMELADDQVTGGQINPDNYAPRTLKSDLLFHGRLPFEECVRIGLALATALEHLHTSGLVHRDVKPSNIIFVNGVPKLADIGLVTGVDATRSYVGTEGFAAPEGSGTSLADLYSLGKVLYEISTGKDRQEFPELPTQLRELPDREGLMELNAVIARACRHDPKDRYVSAAAMRADLELLQSGKSLARLHRTEAQLRFVQRAGAVVTAVAALIAAAWFWQARQTHIVRELADEKTRLADENRHRIVRLNVANGVRLLDEGDPTGALLWFADTLPLVTNQPAEESIHRIRIQQTLNQIPRLLQILPHEHEVTATAFSDNGRRIVTGTKWGDLCVWDAHSGAPLWQPLALGVDSVAQARFTGDGQRVFASSLPHSGSFEETRPTNVAAIYETETGRRVVFLSGTNLVRGDLSPDDRWLVTADTSHTLHVYDARDGRMISEWQARTNRILQFHFSANGNILATRSEDHPARFQTVQLWRLPRGEPLESSIRCARGPVVVSPDGKLLVTAGALADGGTDSVVQTWDTETGASMTPSTRMPGTVAHLGFTASGRRGLLVATDKQCVLLDPVSHRQLVGPLQTPATGGFLAASADGRLIAFGGNDGVDGVWSLETGEMVLPSSLRGASLTDAKFSPDSTQLLATSVNGTATLLSTCLLREGALHRFDAVISGGSPTSLLESCRFTPDRRHFLLILGDGSVRRVDSGRMMDQKVQSAQFSGHWANEAAFDPGGHCGAISYWSQGTKLVELWVEKDGTTNRFVLRHPVEWNGSFLFTPDGGRLLTAGNDGQVRIWRTSDGTLERSVVPNATGGLVLFPNGNTALGVSSITKKSALFDLTTGSATATHLPPFEITALRFDSTGDRFASAGRVNWSRVWSARNCEPLSPPLDHGGEVRWADWSPDGKQILTAGLTPEVKVWDASTGEQLLPPLTLGSKPLETAQWSPDGRFIVARSDDKLVRVWDAATGEPVTPLLTHSAPMRMAQLMASNRLVTLSLPNLMRAWDLNECRLPPDVLMDLARLLSGRRLNAVGATPPLKPAELRQLAESLGSSRPELLRVPPGEWVEWHRRQVGAPASVALVNAGLPHLDRLAELIPGDTWVKEQQARFRACQIPARDPTAASSLVDLSSFYTHSFDMMPGKEFASLPRGINALAGTPFDLRGLIRLQSMDSPDAIESFPLTAVNRIPVGRHCRQLHFLQFTGGYDGRDGEEVAHWVMHFADGTSREWPIIYGEQVRDWWLNENKPREASQAVIAWEGQIPLERGAQTVRLFKSTWTNPRQEVEVRSLDFVLGQANVRPFVVAITAE